jgi:hypothetical protein
MRLSHSLARTSAVFDESNLVSSGGLVPALALADRAGLGELADEHLIVPTDKGANAGLKVASLVGGMVAGADSIDDMGLLRHGGMTALANPREKTPEQAELDRLKRKVGQLERALGRKTYELEVAGELSRDWE